MTESLIAAEIEALERAEARLSARAQLARESSREAEASGQLMHAAAMRGKAGGIQQGVDQLRIARESLNTALWRMQSEVAR